MKITGTVSVRHRGTWIAVSSIVLLLAGLDGICSAQPAKKTNVKAKPTSVTRTTQSGIAINMTYFPSEKKEESAVVVLLHGKGGMQKVWRKFALQLQENNFAVITVDLSGHGESGSRTAKSAASNSKKESGPLRAAEYQAMVADDLEAVKDYILELHAKQELNATKLAIVGADFSTAVAIAFADFDWSKPRYNDAPIDEEKTPRGEDVRALVLLSPEDHAPGLNIPQSCFRLRSLGMPVMIGVAKKDKADRGASKKLFEHLAPKKHAEGEKEHVYLQEYEGSDRGTDLLDRDKQRVEANMLAFLKKHLDELDYPWKDRRSRLETDASEK